MKDITHYFNDLCSNRKSKSLTLNKIRVKRAKIDNTTAIVNKNLRMKKNNGKVKIRICNKSNEDTFCNIIKSSIDLVDNMPSYLNSQNNKTISNDNLQKTNLSKIDSDLNVQNNSFQINIYPDDSKKTDVQLQIKNQFYDLIEKRDSAIPNKDFSSHTSLKTVKNDLEKHLFNKKEQVKQNQAKKLIELENNKKQLKRKMIEEVTKVENKLGKKKKKNSTIILNRNLEITQSDENNSPKKNDFSSSKHSENLINYFSKTSHAEYEKESLMKTKITVKAEIHKSQNSSNSIYTKFDKKEKILSKTKNVTNLKQLQDDFDDIHLIESETLVLSSESEKVTSSIQQNKQKWSLKIQFQSNNIHTSDIIGDSDIHTSVKPIKLQTENMKYNNKIPKILLPIKNKKEDSTLDICANKTKKEGGKNFKINEETFKTKINKSTVNKKLNHSTNGLECKSDAFFQNQQAVHFDCQIINNSFFKEELKEKLAPLFIRKIRANSKIIASNSLTLQSDAFANDNSKIQKLIPHINVESVKLPFPKISHITQLPFENHRCDQIYNFSTKSNENLKQLFDLSDFKNFFKFDCVIQTPEILYECIKSDIELSLFEIKSYCSDAQVLWKSISKHKNFKQNLKIRCKTSNKKMFNQLSKNNLQNELSNYLWTEKYRPKSSTEIIGNDEAVTKLKSWLNNWKSFKSEDYSSSEEFCTSDWSATNCVKNEQVAILIGPHGSGKTASVYAIANELGYKILEVNASSKRPGKKILKDFEEATKSHTVEKLNLKNIFVLKSEKKQSNKNSENSLILIEDVDLVFEEDDGFVSATFHLACNTKRPIIMTVTNNCFHLYKMAPQKLQINFQPVIGEKLLALLQLITLSETGYKLSRNCLNVLCENGDLRKALLQLQYLLLSSKKHIKFSSLAMNNSYWMNLQNCIYKAAIKTEKNKKKKQIFNDPNFNSNVLENLVYCLDSFTLMSILLNINDQTAHLFNLKFEANMSLSENPRFYSSLDHVSLEIGNWLNVIIKKSFSNDLKKSNSHQLLIKKEENSIDMALSQIASITLDRQALAIDYLSNIRTICRAEEVRNQFNNKRGNRFFHYLQNFKLLFGTAKSRNILSAACKILEKTSTALVNLNE